MSKREAALIGWEQEFTEHPTAIVRALGGGAHTFIGG